MAQKHLQTGYFYRADEITTRDWKGNTYYERKFYIDLSDNPTSPNTAQFIFKGKERCESIDALRKGELVQVAFGIVGREYDKRDGSGIGFFQNLEAWSVSRVKTEAVSSAPRSMAPASGFAPGEQSPASNLVHGELNSLSAAAAGEDDLPF